MCKLYRVESKRSLVVFSFFVWHVDMQTNARLRSSLVKDCKSDGAAKNKDSCFFVTRW